LRDLYQREDEFAMHRHWLNPRSILAEMKRVCDAAEVEMLLVFAPTKAHVTMPLAIPHLAPQKVRAFTQLDYDEELPDPETFLRHLQEHIDARERVVGEWCEGVGVPFVSLTRGLQEAIQGGSQVYYTYDQHWTPEGHEVAARLLSERLSQIASPARGRSNVQSDAAARPNGD
jgi:hypothetical protein